MENGLVIVEAVTSVSNAVNAVIQVKNSSAQIRRSKMEQLKIETEYALILCRRNVKYHLLEDAFRRMKMAEEEMESWNFSNEWMRDQALEALKGYVSELMDESRRLRW